MKEEMIGREMSGCESLIMKIVWDAKGDVSTQDLIRILNERFGKDYARTTVVTLVNRLKNKGFVSSYRIGRASFVHAEKTEEEYTQNLIGQQTDFWFMGSEAKLVAALCKNRSISEEEKTKIKDILDGLDN